MATGGQPNSAPMQLHPRPYCMSEEWAQLYQDVSDVERNVDRECG